MPNTTIEGSCISHSTITDECRTNRGNVGALAEAYRRLLKQYRHLTEDAPHGAKIGAGFVFHVVLTIERPPSN
jgi:hypothetical protein